MAFAQELGVSENVSLSVGPLPLDGRVLLAPMSGVTDVGMRRIARRFGAALVVTEMVACDTYLAGEGESNAPRRGEGVAPHVVQLVGRDPAAMGRAARRARTPAQTLSTSIWVVRPGAWRAAWPAAR